MNFIKNHVFLTILFIICVVVIYWNFFRPVSRNELIDKNSKFYVNDIYMSDGRIYNNYLSDDEKKAYDSLVKAIKKHKGSIEIDLSSYSCSDNDECTGIMQNVYDAIFVDHPELLSFSTFSMMFTDKKVKVSFAYALPARFFDFIGERKIEREIDTIKNNTKNMSDLDKIQYVYYWISSNSKYDDVFTYFSKNQSIYSVFFGDSAVCAAYAKASQVIFQNIGIKSYIVTGNSGEDHAWNIVYYDGNYYNFDSTVAASIQNKDSKFYYDGLDQAEMVTYSFDHADWYPEVMKEGNLIFW